MPKKRTSTAPLRLRTRIDTVEQINDEMRRTYRLFINKTITHAEMSRRRELLVALRAGLPDPIERPKSDDYTALAIHIFSVPSNCFLSFEQIEAAKRNEPIVDIAQCTPLQLEHDEPQLMIDAEPRSNKTFPRLVHMEEEEESEITPEEVRLLTNLSTAITELARRVGVSLEDK